MASAQMLFGTGWSRSMRNWGVEDWRTWWALDEIVRNLFLAKDRKGLLWCEGGIWVLGQHWYAWALGYSVDPLDHLVDLLTVRLLIISIANIWLFRFLTEFGHPINALVIVELVLHRWPRPFNLSQALINHKIQISEHKLTAILSHKLSKGLLLPLLEHLLKLLNHCIEIVWLIQMKRYSQLVAEQTVFLWGWLGWTAYETDYLLECLRATEFLVLYLTVAVCPCNASLQGWMPRGLPLEVWVVWLLTC